MNRDDFYLRPVLEGNFNRKKRGWKSVVVVRRKRYKKVKKGKKITRVYPHKSYNDNDNDNDDDNTGEQIHISSLQHFSLISQCSLSHA